MTTLPDQLGLDGLGGKSVRVKEHVEMKPVAEVTVAKGLTHGNRPNLPIGTLLFTSDQLRQAKVEVLREAAEKLHDYGNPWVSKELRHMADEIEKGEQ